MPLSYLLEQNTIVHNRYQIARLIGQGGMGAVYQALDLRLKAPVALKQMLAGGPPYDQAFQREARILAGLRHPALPRVIDYFGADDEQFLVMEFIPGDDLMARLAQRGAPFAPAEVAAWADQLLDALEYLHSQQPPVLHRDIKPQNLKLTARGSIVLLDFGLAKGAIGTHAPALSGVSVFGYTPQYAPLEQIRATGTDERSDLYALAATLYHLLAGAPPPDVLERASALICGQPDPLRPIDVVNPRIPAGFGAPLMPALALDPAQRPACATDLRAALAERHPDLARHDQALPTSAPATLPHMLEVAPVTIREPAIPRWPEIEAAAPLSHPRERRQELQPERRLPAWIDYRLGLLITLTVIAAIMWSQYRALPSPTASTASASSYLLSEPIRYYQNSGGLSRGGARFSPDGKMIAVATEQGKIHLLRTSDGSEICATDSTMVRGWDEVQLGFSPDSQIVGLGMTTAGLSLWRTSNCTLQRTLSGGGGTEGKFAYAPNGQTIAASVPAGVILWSAESGLPQRTIPNLNNVAELVFTPDSASILVFMWSGEIQQVRVADGSRLRQFQPGEDHSLSLALAPDGQTFVVGALEGHVQARRLSDDALLYNITTGFSADYKIVPDIAFSPDGQMIAIATGGAIELRRAADGALLQSFGEPFIHARTVDFAPDGQTIVASFEFGTVKVWRVNQEGKSAP